MSDVDDFDEIVREHENQDENSNDAQEPVEDEGRVQSDAEAEVDGAEATQGRKVDPTVKKRTRKLIVLNTERLKGSKGVHTIEKLYQGFQFKGKGNEKEDLDRVMKRLEYWSYRMFPKLDFDDILEKIEHLGSKKDMQNHLTKYRTDMISADDDFTVQNDIISDDDDDKQENAVEDIAPMRTESDFLFDELLRQDQLPVPEVAMVDDV